MGCGASKARDAEGDASTPKAQVSNAPAAEADDELMATTRLGISLRGFKRLKEQLEQHFGAERLKEMTTAEANAGWVEVVTAASRSRLVQLQQCVAPEDVGPPTYFISHAWRNRVVLLFDQVLAFLSAASETTCIWVDIICVNQHEEVPAHRHDIAAFADVVRVCNGGTIVVMDVQATNPATRGWCIYEWAHTLAAHGPEGLHMDLSPADRQTVFSTLDVAAAETQFPRDKDMILAGVVAQHGSAQAFDEKLKLQLLLQPLSYRVDLRRLVGHASAAAWDLSAVRQWLSEPLPLAAAGPGPPAEEGHTAAAAAGGAGAERGSRALCVLAGCGQGKATASALVCEASDRSGSGGSGGVGAGTSDGEAGQGILPGAVHAYHFFKHSDARRLEPMRVIKSLAFQLALRLPAVREKLLQLNAGEVSQMTDTGTAFDSLLQQPLLAHAEAGSTSQVVLLLDSLDEADPPPAALPGGPSDPESGSRSPLQQQEERPRAPAICSNKAFQLLAAYLKTLPRFVRFVLSARPDAMAGTLAASLNRTFVRHGGLQQLPLQQLLRHSGATPSGTPSAAAGAAAGTADLDALEVAGAMAPSLSDLHAAYARVFDATSRRLQQQRTRGSAAAGSDVTLRHQRQQQLLGVVLAAQEPLPQRLLASMGFEAEQLTSLPGWPTLFFVDEHRLFTIQKALSDWLCDPGACGPHAVDVRAGHGSIGQRLLADAERGVRSAYALRYLVRHLVACGDGGALLGLLDDFAFLADVCAAGMLHAVVRDLAQAAAAPPQVVDKLRWLTTEQYVLQQARTELDVLQSAISGCPIKTYSFASAQRRFHELEAAEGRQLWGASQTLGTTGSWGARMTTIAGTRCSVTHVAVSPDGRAVASADVFGNVWLFDIDTGETSALLRGHTEDVMCVAWRPDGAALASIGEDGTARLWDASSGECSMVLQVSEASPEPHIAWSNDGGRIATSTTSEGPLCIGVWDAATGTLLCSLQGHTGIVTCLAFSPCGKKLASCSHDQSLRLWDVATWACVLVNQEAEAMVWGLSWSPDSSTIAINATEDVLLVDVAAGKTIAQLKGHLQVVKELAWSPDGRMLASASHDCNVRLWDVAAKTCCAVLQGHMHFMSGIAWARGSSRLVTASRDATMAVWDVPAALAEHAALYNESVQGTTHTGACFVGIRVAWSPDGQSMASIGGTDKLVITWDVPSGTIARMCKAGCYLYNVDWSRDGAALACGGDGYVQLLNGTATYADLQTGSGCSMGFAFSPDGSLLAVADNDSVVYVWRVGATAECIAQLKGHTDAVKRVAWSPDGASLASCGCNVVRLWDVAGGGTCIRLLEGHADAVADVAWSPDGASIASCCTSDGTVRVWDAATGMAMMTLQVPLPLCVAWAPSGPPTLACGTGEFNVRLYDAASGALSAVIHGHKNYVGCVAWSRDGAYLASGGYDMKVRICKRLDA